MIFAWSFTAIDWSNPILHTGGWQSFIKFLSALFPPELSPAFLILCVKATWQTIVFAVTGISIAFPLGLILGIIASGKIIDDDSHLKVWVIVPTRFLLALMRSIHELVWAVLLVAALGLSPLAAIVALAIPYAGILGRIYAELLQDTPSQPILALKSTGASPFKIICYGLLPLSLPDMLGYTFYRFECAIRAAAILSFIGIQGIGYQIQLSLHDLLFNQVWTLLIFLLVLIVVVDFWSGKLRRSLTE